MEKKVEDQIDQLSKALRPLDTKQDCSFIVNTIMHAELDNESESESSDDDLDSDSESFDFKFDVENIENHPFRAYTSGSHIKVPFEFKNISQTQNESKILLPFLNKLEKTGLEKYSKEKLSDLISCVIFLNRPLSLSSRKNNILIKEFSANTELSGIKHKIIAGFWSIIWKDKNKKLVKYSRVRKFYKKYKKISAEKAKKFRELNEELNQNIQVPYQVLREFAKNHISTKYFIREAKKKSQHVYLSFVDGDTVSFNGIYSSYLRFYKTSIKYNTIPTVMSTGYEYSSKLQSDRPFIEASKLDRTIRIGIAEIFPQGVYYPEPNFCILVLDNKDCIEVSFIDSKRGKRLESAIILGNLLKNRGDKLWIFANGNPVLIEIPKRVRFIKNHKTIKIKFSVEFQNGKLPTREDFIKYNQISQSSTDRLAIAKNFYINRAFSLDCPKLFNSVVCNLLLSKINSNELDAFNLNKDISNKIKQSIEKVKEIKLRYPIRYTNNLDKLKDYLESVNIDYESYDSDFLEAIANYETILDDIINGEVSIDSFEDAWINGQYDLDQILDMYTENSLHLLFMSSDDPDDVVYQNSDDQAIVEFGLENYDLDLEWIRSQLQGDRDDDSAALMDFNRIVDNYEDYQNLDDSDSMNADNEYYDELEAHYY